MLPTLARNIDVEAVVASELSSINRLLPPRWGDRSLSGNEEAVSSWFRSLIRRDVDVGPEEVVLARKLGRGARPCTVLGLPERLIYRAAVSLIEEHLTPLDRSRDAYESFQQAPLDESDCKYVLKADIASYYQYIDHERLVDEVVAQTGDDLAVTLAVELLSKATSKRFGLPQLSTVSDILADVYIDPMRRDLVRAGFSVWRFADDFRVACSNYAEALAALEAADHAARELGLVLNELKTSTPRIERYRSGLTATQDRERELFESLDVEGLEELGPDEYADAEATGDLERRDTLLDAEPFEEGELVGTQEPTLEESVSDEQLAAASAVVDLWVEEEEDEDTQRSEPAQITARLLERALRVFALGRDSSALDHVTSMLVYEPSLTPTIARYVRECGGSARKAVEDTLDEVCESGIVSTWQALWISYVAGELPRRPPSRNRSHVNWLTQQLQGNHGMVRAEAALALARRRLVTVEKLLEVLTAIPSQHRPTVLLALTALGHEDAASDAADSELDRKRIRWGSLRL